MSKINQIQNRLREIGDAAFQKLADAYLYNKGYLWINPLGSVIGADKTRKGKPDTYVSLPNGKYVFAEYTTQQENLCKKLKSDLEKCFDEERTGVPVEKIEEVVFCHTSTLSAGEENALAEECQEHGVNLSIFSIGPISYDVYQKYPGLARDFLGVEVDTGQIVPPDEFVATYDKNKFAARLDTTFRFREEEVSRVLQRLEEGDLVIISGRAGVGKSRLALECSERFKKAHLEYEVRCIFNRGQDLSQDLRIHFSEPGHFLILVDDANRISRFDYVVQILQDQREDQQIKVVATVRDYALDKVCEAARPLGGRIEVELKPLEENQIKQLVKDEYGIHNYLYLDRIADISQGNPRLAVMAAEVAKREQTLQSVSDVSALYDEYFASIRKDLQELGDKHLIKVAAIVAFFRAVDKSNKEMMHCIENAFRISSEAFWETARRLHDLEILDMYEKEVVRPSDQVLATYLFYLVFFKEKTLDFSALLEHFFPRLRDQLEDAINPVLDAFDTKAIMEAMFPHVDRIWSSMREAGNEEGLLHLMEVFWLVKQTDTLLYARDRIDEIQQEPIDLSGLEFKTDPNIESPSLLNVLGSFRYADDSNFRMALEILFNYLAKRPKQLPQILYLLTNRFGFRPTSYLRGFPVQRAVIDELWKQARNGKDKLFSMVFIAVVKTYLHTHFSTAQLKTPRVGEVIDFHLPVTPELLKLRETIWNNLFKLYRLPALREEVLSVLHSYSTSGFLVSVAEIVAKDASIVVSFIESELDPGSYRHCCVVQDYLDFLDHHKVDSPDELHDRFRSENYALSELLLSDWTEKRNLNLDYHQYQQYKHDKMKEHFAQFTLTDYDRFLNKCLEIQAELDDDHKKFQLHNGVVDVLVNLFERDPDLFVEVVGHYLEMGEPLGLKLLTPVEKLIEACGAKRAYDILSRAKYSTKRVWLFGYYRFLPQAEVTVERLNQLYALYQEAECEDLPYDFDFLLKYRALDEEVVARVTEIILEKAKADSRYARALSMLFDPHSESNKVISDLLETHLNVFKQAYFMASRIDPYVDHDGRTFDIILDVDTNFILEYIDQKYQSKEWLSGHDDIRDYSFLWRRTNYEELMTKVAERIYDWERGRHFGTYLETFFTLRGNGKDTAEIREKQDRFLKGLIESRNLDPEFMRFIFILIAEFCPERRRQFVALFLQYNRDFHDFETLPLESVFRFWKGSAVPMLQRRLKYFESLRQLINTTNLLQHKQYIESHIEKIRRETEHEKKRDFIED